VEDLTEIYLYIAREDTETAAIFINELHKKIYWIAKAGFTGSPRDWIRPGLRAHPYKERCIYFRIKDDELHILRILHARQDVTKQEFEERSA